MFNVRPSIPDHRDRKFQLSATPIKTSVDLRQPGVLIEDQGQLGSCTSNAIVGAYELMVKTQYPYKYVDLSRLFVYYNMRLFYNEVNEDSGGYLRDALKSLKKYGVCAESIWPYDISKFEDQPSVEAYADATKRNINYYESLVTNDEIMQVLSMGNPVVIGIEIFKEFQYLDEEFHDVSMPGKFETPEGAHAVCIVGYDLAKKMFLIKNSFGTDWGDKGYCWMPYEYVTKYAFEKWYFDITDQSTFLT